MIQDELSAIQAEISRRFDSASHWVGSVYVSVSGESAWEGLVEVFDLFGHSTATRCYGWLQSGRESPHRFVLMLREGAITSPEQAVQTFLDGGTR